MFKVEDADFIANKLAAELLPNQEFREVYKNAEEAVERRLEALSTGRPGRIEFDVDWPLLETEGRWFISCADNGDGMTRSQLEKYMTTLAVQGASSNQSIRGNQGMGLKVSGPTRHKKGVLIRSLKDGEATMVQVGWDGHEYGLIPIGDEGEVIVSVVDDMFPAFIVEQGSGTVVTFLGSEDDANTFVPGSELGWLFRYLNKRIFRLSDTEIQLRVRVPSGEQEEWPRSRAEADERERGRTGKSFNLTGVRGTAPVWDAAAGKLGPDHFAAVELPGNPDSQVPPARLHWWVMPSGAGSDPSSRTAGSGSIAVLFQNELHDWRTGAQANPYFARLGVVFGKNRISFVVEPLGTMITSDFARAHVLVAGKPVFESEAWLLWAEQFRDKMPDAIKVAMSEEQARLQEEDPDRARRIRDRLKDVMSLLRPRRFKPSQPSNVQAGGPSVVGPGADAEGPVIEREPGPGPRRPSRRMRGIGAALTQADPDVAQPAKEVYSLLHISPRWVTEREAETFSIVNANGQGLHDRAAALAGEDAATADILLLNRDFRGYQTIIAAVNEWANPAGDEGIATAIENYTQEWIEQKMVEAVQGLRQLENGSTWLASNFDDALSPVALTAAFMADRFHTLREVKRQAGSLRPKGVAA